MNAGRSLFVALLCSLAHGATPTIDILLVHPTAAESETRDQLQRLLKTGDLSGWVWTRAVVIDKDAIPHRPPVLTLHTRHLKDHLLLLSTFVHDQ